MSANITTVTTALPAASERGASRQLRAREYLTFRLGSEEYGMDILHVQEIRGYEPPTRLAGAPDFVLGVLNLRGLIVPIVDLRACFGIEQSFNALTVTVVLNVAHRTVGMVVDSVSDVIELASSQIKPPPEFNDTIDTSHITGIGSARHDDQERMIVLLDIERLATSREMGLGAGSVH